jgi:hypothetical protein
MEDVRNKLRAMEVLLAQIDAVETELVARMYAYDIASARPQSAPEIREDTQEHLAALALTEWRRDRALLIACDMLGVSTVQTARSLFNQLATVYEMYMEAVQENIRQNTRFPILEAELNSIGMDSVYKRRKEELLNELSRDMGESALRQKMLADVVLGLAGRLTLKDTSSAEIGQ